MNEKMYNINEVCEKLKITIWTLKNWYSWEKKRVKDGAEPYLPVPVKMVHQKGMPNMWTEDMIVQLKHYKSTIVLGRNGVYGMYTNPSHKETHKYKKSIENIDK